MTPYTSHTLSNTPDKRDCTYDLFAIVSHIGVNIHKGHYINYAKFNGEWFMFNDHIVEWVPEETVLHSKAYIPPIQAFILSLIPLCPVCSLARVLIARAYA
jgi:ubiquitin C-terminal hydrolase